LFTAGTVSGTFTNTVRVSSGDISSTATVSVTSGTLATITLTPNPVSLLANTTQPFVATGRDAQGNVVAITPTWSIEAGGGTISTSGVFTSGTVSGTYPNTVKASSGGISGSVSVTVASGVLATISITPNPSLAMAIGSTQQFDVVGKDTDGNVVSIAPIWSVEAGGGTISSSGLFTAGTNDGTFNNTVKASSGSISGSVSVTVKSGALASISITPGPVTLAIGGAQQFVATGKDASGNVIIISPTWSVEADGGSISSAGLFTAGTVSGAYPNTVKASSGTISSTASVTVTKGALATLTLTPDPISLSIGNTQQFVATGKDAEGNTVSLSPIWSVVVGGGSINSSGVFKAGTLTGTFTRTVRAISGGVRGTLLWR
jgi:hypothetical protein